MADALFISEQYLKDRSIISDNADMKTITPTIIYCQDLYIQNILGTDLYEDIKTEIIAGSVSSLNSTLLDNYILKPLMFYILCECTPALQFRYMNKGVMTKNSDNSNPVDLSTVQYLMSKWRNAAENYADILAKYLCENSNDYPLYNANTETYKIKGRKNPFYCSLYLPGLDDEPIVWTDK